MTNWAEDFKKGVKILKEKEAAENIAKAERALRHLYNENDIYPLVQMLIDNGVHSKVSEDARTTIWTFDDDSKIKICGYDAKVI